MAKTNKTEAEIDAIRDKIYEETKHLTRDEQAKRLREKVQKLSKQYGFTVVPSAKNSSSGVTISNHRQYTD